ncbi:MAG: hypothetical protein RLY85_636 [Bacteroidota bacterium]|jgi:hypothetical protein
MKKLLTASIMLLAVSFLHAQDKTQDQDRIKLQDKKQIHQYLHLENKEVFLVKDMKRTKLQKELRLKDGTVVQPDGAFRNKKGDRLRLREGECLDMEGNWFANHEKMMERMRNREKEMEKFQPKQQEKMKGLERGKQKNGQ